ncbi:MAG: hypothetical protein HQK63_06220 [Desulfamplus sp.]|nr:hypothetical protein [Desulfamplus sp.]
MTALRVIESQPQAPKPDLAPLYHNAFTRKIDQLLESTKKTNKIDKQLVKQLVYFGIKGLPIFRKEALAGGFDRQIADEDTLKHIFNTMTMIDLFTGHLTPRELMTVFPIEKKYDGKRWEFKDYFSTMEELEKIGLDNPIGENVSELFFDYQNKYIRIYNVNKIGVVDDLRRYNGEKGMLEEFMEQQGVKPLRLMTDDDGKQFMYDPDKQTTYPVSKPRPRYLRVV